MKNAAIMAIHSFQFNVNVMFTLLIILYIAQYAYGFKKDRLSTIFLPVLIKV